MEIFETRVLFIIVFAIICLSFHLEKLFDLKMEKYYDIDGILIDLRVKNLSSHSNQIMK